MKNVIKILILSAALLQSREVIGQNQIPFQSLDNISCVVKIKSENGNSYTVDSDCNDINGTLKAGKEKQCVFRSLKEVKLTVSKDIPFLDEENKCEIYWRDTKLIYSDACRNKNFNLETMDASHNMMEMVINVTFKASSE